MRSMCREFIFKPMEGVSGNYLNQINQNLEKVHGIKPPPFQFVRIGAC